MRRLTAAELNFVTEVALRLDDEHHRAQLLSDARSSLVEDTFSDGCRWTQFHIEGYARPKYEGQRSYGVEGRVSDPNGESTLVDLYADHKGRVLALEVICYRTDGKYVEPDWSAIGLL